MTSQKTLTIKEILKGIKWISSAFKFTDARVQLQEWKLLSKVDDRRWKLEDNFVWVLDYNFPNEVVVVPKWFITDFGSIPRPFWSVLNPTDKISYIIHDYLYTKDAKIYIKNRDNLSPLMYTFARRCEEKKDNVCKPDRFLADLILYQALLVEWMSKLYAAIVFIALRLFGFIWRHNR